MGGKNGLRMDKFIQVFRNREFERKCNTLPIHGGHDGRFVLFHIPLVQTVTISNK